MMYRLAAAPQSRENSEWIDRSQELRFEFEGRAFKGFAGDTISTALAASGEMMLARSFKYHRPRGIHSLANHDANNLFQVNGVPNVRGDVTALAQGMRVTAVNTFNGLAHDGWRFLEWLSPFLPAGFYYKAFHGRRFARWEQRIRRISGLGVIDPQAAGERTPKRYAFCDVLVIGAGMAGLEAAVTAAESGARVLLVDEQARPGGGAPWSGLAAAELNALVARVLRHENVEFLPRTFAAGFYADRWVALVEPGRMSKVRARAVIVATGVIEQPIVFGNNDLPGVLLGSAAQRLVHRYGIAPGRRAVVLTANREGYDVARLLRAHGVALEAVLDLRPDRGGDAQGLAEVRCLVNVAPEKALAGRGGAVRGLRVRLHGAKQSETLRCDSLIMSAGFAPAGQLLAQAGASLEYEAALRQHVPAKLPPGVFATGRVNGAHELATRRQEARAVGDAAAGYARGSTVELPPRMTATRAVSHDFPVFAAAGAKRFVDLDEDLVVEDLLTSAQEGFDSPELLKRFSTLGMGPSQGKLSNLNGARILLQARGGTLADTPLTTQRPFCHPVPLKHLAGARFHPDRVVAARSQHQELDAVWMTIGGWKRPEYYARAGSDRAACIAGEVRAVRESVGLIDVSTLGKIEIHGPDAGRFLDRMYAGNFSDLAVGTTRYGLLLDETGTVRDDGVVARMGEASYYFTTTTGGAANVYRDLLLWNTRWRLDCTFTNCTGHRAAFNVAGPASREVLQSLTEIDLSAAAFPHLGYRSGRVDGVPARVLRAGFVSSLGFEIHVPYGKGPQIWKTLMHAGAAQGIRAFGVEAQRVLRLEKGHAIIGQDTDGVTNPFEAGLGWAVRMAKPFFVGQRSLKIHQRRGPRQKLVGFEIADSQAPVLEANLLIEGGEIAGRVTSVACSPTMGRVIGLAMAAPRLSEPGSALSIRTSDGGLVAARVVGTPFVEAA